MYCDLDKHVDKLHRVTLSKIVSRHLECALIPILKTVKEKKSKSNSEIEERKSSTLRTQATIAKD